MDSTQTYFNYQVSLKLFTYSIDYAIISLLIISVLCRLLPNPLFGFGNFYVVGGKIMMDVLEKLVGLFCLIVFVTFLVNHGHIDFSGVDWVKEKTTEAITSEEAQQYVEETKKYPRLSLGKCLMVSSHYLSMTITKKPLQKHILNLRKKSMKCPTIIPESYQVL